MNHVRFMFNRIKDYSLIYEEIPCPTMLGFEEYGTIEEKDHIKEYCTNILNDVLPKLHYESKLDYSGCMERFGNEVFTIKTSEAIYTISFTVDTFHNKKNAIMYVDIVPEYFLDETARKVDLFLEKLKIEIKNRSIKDWDFCSWLIDEQSEQLCSELYPDFFRLENEARAFIGRVLSFHIGFNWLDCFGLEKYSESSKERSEVFQQRVPEFENVNTQLMSLTLEALFDIVFNGVIFKDESTLSIADFKTIEKICKLGSIENVCSFIENKREIKYKIWDELLKPYFKDPEKFHVDVTKFINSRNHIAHNKLISWNAYKIIIDELDNIQSHLDFANDNFDRFAVSKEIEYTLDALSEQENYDERSYWRSRVANETGIEVLDSDEIEERFHITLVELYDELIKHFQYDQCFSLSDYNSSVQTGTIFKITCNAAEEEQLDIDIDMEIDDDMGEDSNLYVFCRKRGDDIYKCTIHFANGLGSEDDEFRMQVDQDSVYEDEEIADFTSKIIDYIKNELNPYVSKMYSISYEDKAITPVVSELPCEFCGNFGVSIHEDFYPIGYCCYCGEENDINRCELCGSILDESIGENNICNKCNAD